MKFYAPFVFKAEVSFDDPNRSDDNLFGRKSTKTKLLMSAVEVEMENFNDEEAPIVALINETHWNREDSTFTIRHHNGEFFYAPRERMTLASISECDLLHLFMPLDANVLLSTQYAEVFNKWKRLKDRNADTLLGIDPGEEIVTGMLSSRKQFHADQLLENLKKYALIDGELWIRIQEPKIVTAITAYISDLPRIEFVAVPDTTNIERDISKQSEPLIYDCFNLADWEGVQDFYNRLEREIERPSNKLTVTVFDPEVFGFQRKEDIAKRLITTFLRDGQDNMMSKTKKFVMDWLTVRDASSEALSADQTNQVIEIIKSSLHEMTEASQRKLQPAIENWVHEVSRHQISKTFDGPTASISV